MCEDASTPVPRSYRAQDVMRMSQTSSETLARLLGISEKELVEWIEEKPEPRIGMRVTLSRLFILFQGFPPPLKKSLVAWLEKPNPKLNNRRPIDHLRWQVEEKDPSNYKEVEMLVERISEELETAFSAVTEKTGFELKS